MLKAGSGRSNLQLSVEFWNTDLFMQFPILLLALGRTVHRKSTSRTISKFEASVFTHPTKTEEWVVSLVFDFLDIHFFITLHKQYRNVNASWWNFLLTNIWSKCGYTFRRYVWESCHQFLNVGRGKKIDLCLVQNLDFLEMKVDAVIQKFEDQISRTVKLDTYLHQPKCIDRSNRIFVDTW